MDCVLEEPALCFWVLDDKYWVTIQIKLNKIPTGPTDGKLLYSTE